MAAMKLEVSIIQATGLHHLNMTGDSMYCVCEVQHHDRHAHKVKCETHVQKSLDPLWNEVFEVEPWHEGEALEFSIYDKGMLNSKVEGKVVVPSEYFYPNGFEGQLQISGLDQATLYVVIRPLGMPMMEGQPMDGQQHQQDMAMQQELQGQDPYMEGPPQKLQVTIIQAVGLEHMNHFTGDSPYVVCEVEHVNKHEKHKQCKFQTKAVKGLSPVWNETKELDPWHIGEPIKFSVLDKGLMGSKTEGVVSVPSELFYPNGFEGPLTIPNKERSQLFVQIVPIGPSTVDLQLEVTIIQANNLKHLMHFTGDSPYITCSVKHTKSRSKAAKFQTKTIKHGSDPLDPVFDETHMLGPWTWDEPLEFCVYDKGLLGAKSEGKVTLAAEHFYPMGLEGTMQLDGCPEATLTVRIVPAGPWSATSTTTTVRPGQFVSGGVVSYPSQQYTVAPMSPASYVSPGQPYSLPPQPVTYAAPASMQYASQPMAQPVTYAMPSSQIYAAPSPVSMSIAAPSLPYASPTSMSYAAPSMAATYAAPASPTYAAPSSLTYAAPSAVTYAAPPAATYAAPSAATYAAPSAATYAPAPAATYAAPSAATYSAPAASYAGMSMGYTTAQPPSASYALPTSSLRTPMPASASPMMYSSPQRQTRPMASYSAPMAQPPMGSMQRTFAAPSMGYRAAPQAAGTDMFAMLDANNDGKITRAEFQAFSLRR